MSALPAPLPVEQEQLVIVEIIDNIAQTGTLHLPAPTRFLEPGRTIKFADVDWHHRWVSVCGVEGYVYAKAGSLARIEVCGKCESQPQRTRPIKHGTVTGYTSHGCRCSACVRARRHYDSNRYHRLKKAAA